MQAPVRVVSPGRVAGAAATQAHAAARGARPGLVVAGRLGYLAAGLLYGMVGILAVQSATGTGGATSSTGGVLPRILDAPFGRLAMVLLAVGLAGYAIWGFLCAALDCDRKGSDAKGIAARAGNAISGIVYGGLALTAVKLVLGKAASPSGDQQTQDQTAWLLHQPFGPWLVGAVGLVVAGVGISQFIAAYRGTFMKRLGTAEMGTRERVWAERIGRLGYAARGVVFVMSGIFFVSAARTSQADEAKGLDGVLASLADRPYGPFLLGVVAAGLVAYAAFMIIQARYRQIDVG